MARLGSVPMELQLALHAAGYVTARRLEACLIEEADAAQQVRELLPKSEASAAHAAALWPSLNSITSNAAISACEKGARPGRASELFEAMPRECRTTAGTRPVGDKGA